MRNAIALTVPFQTAVGTAGAVHLQHDGRFGGKAHLSIAMGYVLHGGVACAHLPVDGLRQLVDGLMDCIHTLERNARIAGENSDGGMHGHAT